MCMKCIDINVVYVTAYVTVYVTVYVTQYWTCLISIVLCAGTGISATRR